MSEDTVWSASLDKDELAWFFNALDSHAINHMVATSEAPTLLLINTELLGRMARIEGFYQRPEVRTLIPAHAPLVRRMQLTTGVVTIEEDLDEKFFHYE